MNTITKCFLFLAVEVALIFALTVTATANVFAKSWVWFAVDIALIAINVLMARLIYRRARFYEDSIRVAIAELKAEESIRLFREYLKSVRDKEDKQDKGDELEKR